MLMIYSKGYNMRRIVILLVTILVFSGCENFLDLTPKSEVLGDKLFQSEEGFEDALYGVYTALAQKELYGEKLSYYLPDMLAQYYVYENVGGYMELLLTFQYMNSNFTKRSMFDDIWKLMYENISHVNSVLTNLEGRENSLRYYNFYKGEALALRAFMHFQLLNAFAPAYREETVDYPAIPYCESYEPLVYPFRTVGAIYRKVIDELKEAEGLLQDEGSYLNLERVDRGDVSAFMTQRQFHMNLYAVQGLLARVYMMKNDLDSAVIYAEKVIESEKFEFANKTNMGYEYASCVSRSETIWAVYPQKNWTEAMKEHFDDEQDEPKPNVLLPLNGFYLYPGYYPEGMVPVDYGFRKLYEVPSTGGEMDYRINWFRQREGVSGKHARFYKIFRNAGTVRGTRGIHMMRISEMYLIMAEGLLKQGKLTEAQRYLDSYTQARGFVYRNVTLDMTLINKEYRKEFWGEGLTWFNMKRQNMSINSCLYYGMTYEGSDEVYVWPIPDDEFEYREGGREGVFPPVETEK